MLCVVRCVEKCRSLCDACMSTSQQRCCQHACVGGGGGSSICANMLCNSMHTLHVLLLQISGSFTGMAQDRMGQLDTLSTAEQHLDALRACTDVSAHITCSKQVPCLTERPICLPVPNHSSLPCAVPCELQARLLTHLHMLVLILMLQAAGRLGRHTSRHCCAVYFIAENVPATGQRGRDLIVQMALQEAQSWLQMTGCILGATMSGRGHQRLRHDGVE